MNLEMKPDRLQHILQHASDKRFLVVGDVMLDRFIYGRVSRISPEAPVPVVEVTDETNYPGGAANVARNLIPFCPSVALCGLTGEDGNAVELRSMLEQCGIDTQCLLAMPSHQTTVKTRVIARHQQMVRVDREKKCHPSPDEIAQVAAAVVKAGGAAGYDGVIFEDYAKGFLTQALVDAVRATLPTNSIITVDPNPGNNLEWKGVTALKPNRSEAYLASGMPEEVPTGEASQDASLHEVGRRLMEKSEAGLLLVTLGEHGMMLFQPGQPPHHTPTRAREVFDVSGAGDTAISLFTLALCGGASAIEAAEIANLASGIVVGKLGTATISPEELLAAAKPD